MTLLPLLYPEIFQRFNVTPPRGILSRDPPGIGKTLLARALAASCRKDGKQICESLCVLHFCDSR
jgi:SpoVK/Ycf46/Vps4 family AAA+-type ATPase